EVLLARAVYRQRLAHLKAQSPSSQVEFEMARVLFRLRPAQTTIDQKFGGKRVCPRIRSSGNGSFSMHTKNYVGLSSAVQIRASLFKNRAVFVPPGLCPAPAVMSRPAFVWTAHRARITGWRQENQFHAP